MYHGLFVHTQKQHLTIRISDGDIRRLLPAYVVSKNTSVQGPRLNLTSFRIHEGPTEIKGGEKSTLAVFLVGYASGRPSESSFEVTRAFVDVCVWPFGSLLLEPLRARLASSARR
jgi:hypothetical protein